MAGDKYNTRYLTIDFMDRLSRDDLVVFYRIIKECHLADVQNPEESIQEDLDDDIRTFRFVVHEPKDSMFTYLRSLLKAMIPVDYMIKNAMKPDQEFEEWLKHRENMRIEEKEEIPRHAEVPDLNETIRRLNIRMCALEENTEQMQKLFKGAILLQAKINQIESDMYKIRRMFERYSGKTYDSKEYLKSGHLRPYEEGWKR